MYFHHATETSSMINKARFCKQGLALKTRKSDWNAQKAEWKEKGSTILKKISSPGITTFQQCITRIHSVKEFI